MNITWLLIRRDFVERVRQRSFIIGTIVFVVFIMAFAFLRPLLNAVAGASEVRLGVVAPDAAATSAIRDSLPKTDFVLTFERGPSDRGALPPAALKDLDAGKVDAVLVAYRDAKGQLGFSYYPKRSTALQSSSDLHGALLRAVLLARRGSGGTPAADALSFSFAVHSLNQRYKSDEEQAFSQGIAYFLLVILYIAVIVYGAYVAQGVIEEKSNRIMEVMIGAVRPSQLLAGKIFGIGAVALLQLTINALAAAAATILYGILYVRSAGPAVVAKTAAASVPQQAAAMEAISHVPWSTLIFLIVFFLLGFFTYAALFAGLGSLLNKPEDVQQYSAILTMPIVAAYILAILALYNPDLPLVTWGSLVPLISPLLMFTRIATSDVPAWQVAVSIGGSMLAIWGLTILAGKLYRVGVLMYGKPPKPLEIWRALRAHT